MSTATLYLEAGTKGFGRYKHNLGKQTFYGCWTVVHTNGTAVRFHRFPAVSHVKDAKNEARNAIGLKGTWQYKPGIRPSWTWKAR